MKAAKYTTIASWSLAIARALSASGINPEAIFEGAGLSLAELENNPTARVPIDNMTQLWQTVESTSQSSAFGLIVAQYAYPIHFQSLGSLIMGSDSLAKAFETLPTYYTLVSNSVVITLQRTPQLIGFTITPLEGVIISDLSIDAFFATLMFLGQQMVGNISFVRKVELIRTKPSSLTPWQDCFKCPIIMQSSNNCMWMDRRTLEQQIQGKVREQYCPQTSRENKKEVHEYLDTMQALTWREKTSQGIHACIMKGEPTPANIARMYNISTRSLSRNLHAENTHFRLLLQQKRQELAQHYLLNTNIAITELSDLLGYSNISNFSRTFKKWTMKSPQLYRNLYRKL